MFATDLDDTLYREIDFVMSGYRAIGLELDNLLLHLPQCLGLQADTTLSVWFICFVYFISSYILRRSSSWPYLPQTPCS